MWFSLRMYDQHGDCWYRSTTGLMTEAPFRSDRLTLSLPYFLDEVDLAEGEICGEFA
jgi:hypothetical protein